MQNKKEIFKDQSWFDIIADKVQDDTVINGVAYFFQPFFWHFPCKIAYLDKRLVRHGIIKRKDVSQIFAGD